MSSSLSSHVSSDKRKWAAVTIALLVIIAVIVSGILTDWYTVKDKYCLFGHDYDDAGVCVRCGADKPEDKVDINLQAVAYEFATMDLLNAAPSGLQPFEWDKYYDYVGGNWDGVKVNGSFITSDRMTIKGSSFSISSPSYDLVLVDGDDMYSVPQNTSFTQAGTYCFYILADEGDYYEVDACYITLQYNETQLPPTPVKVGYTFTGWYTDEACTNKYTAPTVIGDITLYAGFRANTYSIKFNANSGSGNMSNLSMTYDEAKNLTANAFTKDHYAFKGWATSANGAVVHADKASVKNLNATDGAIVELFAVWERSEVKVDFVANGNTTTTWVAINTKATLPANPTKEGYNFVGWYLADGTQYTTQTLSEDTTLTARFEIIKCTVTFIVDGEVYATYICDWGTSLAEALNANNVNPVLLAIEGDEYSRNF